MVFSLTREPLQQKRNSNNLVTNLKDRPEEANGEKFQQKTNNSCNKENGSICLKQSILQKHWLFIGFRCVAAVSCNPDKLSHCRKILDQRVNRGQKFAPTEKKQQHTCDNHGDLNVHLPANLPQFNPLSFFKFLLARQHGWGYC